MGESNGEGKPVERLSILETSDQKHYTVVAYSDHDAVDSKDPIMMTTTTPVNAEDMPSLWEKLIAAQADGDYCNWSKLTQILILGRTLRSFMMNKASSITVSTMLEALWS
mmetsp:Transcript_4398/g.13011  ORF Transcript_4398/g.13011 Transcript_4398/m.13011 type:complete len:110 (-) Transcript_4398:545-874(-)